MKRKPPGGLNKPRNTLNLPGPGTNTLSTITSRGQNVSGASIKRQKTSHDFPEDAADEIPDAQFWNRGLRDQPSTSLERQHSIGAISINSQETPSQKSSFFGYNEARDVHGILNHSKKKGRKPKVGTTQCSSSPQHGASNNPVAVDDDDDVGHSDEQQNAPRSVHHRAGQWKPPSPPLAHRFIRDDSAPDLIQESRQPPSKITSKMQSVSNTSRIVQPPPVVEELSEDELSREHEVQSPVQRPRKAIRSPSPNALTSTHFAKESKKPGAREILNLPLTSLRMMAGNWQDLYLMYSWTDKVMQFNKNGDMLSYHGTKIQLSSIHASTVLCDSESSTAVVLIGSNGGPSKGRVLFDFNTASDREIFLKVVNQMNPRVTRREFEGQVVTFELTVTANTVLGSNSQRR